MRSADAEPSKKMAFGGQGKFRLHRAADRTADHDRDCLSATLRRDAHLGGRVAPAAIKGTFVFPGSPHYACETVGERNSGFVVAALSFTVERPLAQTIDWFARSLRPVRGPQCGPCAVNHEGSQIHVSLLRDSSESSAFCTRSLSRGKT
jgi:hypothetical protein